MFATASSPRVRAAAAAAALGLLAGLSSTATPAPAASLTPSNPGVGRDVIFDVDAKAVLDWSLPKRYKDSWSAYFQPTSSYDVEFVNPQFWRMNLDGCDSTAVRPIETYSFTVAQIGTTWTRTINSGECAAQVTTLPEQGLYRVSLTLHTDWGAVGDGVSAPTSMNAGVRDYLIVTVGDSLASGEGNPDSLGNYDVEIGKSWNIIDIVENRPVRWQDPRCHRSARTGPALAAQEFENANSRTSVTYVNLACSGAELKHLIDTQYGGIEPDGTRLDPQIQAVAQLFGKDSRNGARRIDALTVTAGINDLHFSDIIRRCATNVNAHPRSETCVTSGGIAQQLTTLPAKYSRLARAININLPDIREVYLNDYPGEVFDGGGCGLLGMKGAGITQVEESEMNIYGNGLNGAIRRAVLQFDSASHRWNFADSLALDFGPHSYCDRPTWFSSLEKSLATQGNVLGTAHPNSAGHIQFGAILRHDIVLDQASSPYRQLKVTIDAVKVKNAAGDPDMTVLAKMWRFQNDYVGETHSFTVPRDGEWTTVPEGQRNFSLDVYRSPSSPRHAVRLDMILNGNLPFHHTLGDGYGAGTHVLVHPTGSIAVRYTVEVKTPLGGQVIG